MKTAIYDNNLFLDEIEKDFTNKSHIISDDIYKSHVLSVQGHTVKDDFIHSIKSTEIIPIKKAILLKNIILYMLKSTTFTLSESNRTRANSNYKTITSILNGIEDGSYFFEKELFELCLVTNNSYGYTRNYELGRLFPRKASINHLSREFRYILFKDIYTDIDIKNAHPTILLEYAIGNMIHTPALLDLVNNRDVFYATVLEEYTKETSDFAETIDIKMLTLAVLNMSRNNFKSKSLNGLANDVMKIRDSLYKEYYLNNQLFKTAIDYRCSLENRHITLSMITQKTQTLYCFDNETKHILKLKKFIHEKTNNAKSSFVPFYDGFYLRLDDNYTIKESNFQGRKNTPELEDLIQEYNKDKQVQFSIKEIAPDYKLLSKELYTELSALFTHIDTMSHQELQRKMDDFKVDFSIDISTIKDKKVKLSYEQIENLKEQNQNIFVQFVDYLRQPK